MKMRKLTAAGMFIYIMALCLCACGSRTEKPENADQVEIVIKNEVPDHIKALSVTYLIGENMIGTEAVEAAGDAECLSPSAVSFILRRGDVPSEKDLQKLSVMIQVTEAGGETFDVASLALPSSLGDRHELVLKYDDDSYQLWHVLESGETELVSD